MTENTPETPTEPRSSAVPTPAPADPARPDRPSTPRALAEIYFDCWQRADFAVLHDRLADDVTFDGPLANLVGRDDCLEGPDRPGSRDHPADGSAAGWPTTPTS